MPFNVFVTRAIPQAGLDLLQPLCDVHMNPEDRVLSRQELLEAVQGRDAVLSLLTDTIDDAILEAAGPRCRVFSNYAVGYNNIDVAAATRRGILVTNTPGVLTETTADTAWVLLMAVARRVVEADRFFRSGKWTGWGPMQFLGRDIHGATLGIVGAGRIGTAMARRAIGFGMKVLYHDAGGTSETVGRLGGRQVSMEQLLQQSDFLTLHVDLNEQTRHLIGARELSLMKRSAYLINTARGPVVDETALVAALREGTIAGAGLDVYENEPHPTAGLTELENVVCLPHLGSATEATREKMSLMAAENLLAAVKGERPPYVVNPEVLEMQRRPR